MKVVECVPNFSEGRRPETVAALAQAAVSGGQVVLLDQEMDADHHRSVLTLAGEPQAVLDGVFQAIRLASQTIDLRLHRGAHPRIGATDVVPFVPLREMTMDECVVLAHRLGERVGRELQIPVYYYGEAAKRPDRRNLSHIRRGQFEGLREAIATDPDRLPDEGPAVLHPSAGAVAMGARFFLIAYNINLATRDAAIAKAIAKAIRESEPGGLPKVKALGFDLPARGLVQVSMNLTDYRVTSIAQVFDRVAELAAASGVEVAESELVGLVPQAALDETVARRVKLRGFSPDQVIEERLRRAGWLDTRL